MNDLIINFTPTGMIPTKEMTPYVPEQPQEIIESVLNAYKIGITSVHLHVRDIYGKPSLDSEIYKEVISKIRKISPDLVICVSTSGRSCKNVESRILPLLLKGDSKPDMASLTLSSLNFNKEASINQPEDIKKLASVMLDNNIKPELEIFDLGMVNYMKYLIGKNILRPPYYVNIILGNISCSQADLLHLSVILKDLPECLWSIGGIGDFQLSMNSLSIAIGGGVRVGIEDNIWFDLDRTKLARNEDLLNRIHSLANIHNRKIMSPIEFRKRLEIK